MYVLCIMMDPNFVGSSHAQAKSSAGPVLHKPAGRLGSLLWPHLSRWLAVLCLGDWPLEGTRGWGRVTTSFLGSQAGPGSGTVCPWLICKMGVRTP